MDRVTVKAAKKSFCNHAYSDTSHSSFRDSENTLRFVEADNALVTVQ